MFFINFANTEFKCPYCLQDYSDADDKYLNRMEKNYQYKTLIWCNCKEKFWLTYNYQGDAMSFKIQKHE